MNTQTKEMNMSDKEIHPCPPDYRDFRITELETALRDLLNDCMASDFNEHWDSFKDAESLLNKGE